MTDHIPDPVKMVPGPDLDRLVAEKVMGWILRQITEPDSGIWFRWEGRRETAYHRLPMSTFKPSTDITHSWEVVEHLNKTKSIEFRLGYLPSGRVYANFNFQSCNDVSDSATHAICLAALRSVGAV